MCWNRDSRLISGRPAQAPAGPFFFFALKYFITESEGPGKHPKEAYAKAIPIGTAPARSPAHGAAFVPHVLRHTRGLPLSGPRPAWDHGLQWAPPRAGPPRAGPPAPRAGRRAPQTRPWPCVPGLCFVPKGGSKHGGPKPRLPSRSGQPPFLGPAFTSQAPPLGELRSARGHASACPGRRRRSRAKPRPAPRAGPAPAWGARARRRRLGPTRPSRGFLTEGRSRRLRLAPRRPTPAR